VLADRDRILMDYRKIARHLEKREGRLAFMPILITTRGVMVLLALGTALAGCGDSGSSAPPTGPSSVGLVPSPLGGGQWISGTVSDTGLRTLAGATVELLDGPQAGSSTTTNLKGEFSIFGTVDDTTRFRASRDGHVPAVATIQPDCERCNPRRWVHLFMNVLDPPAAIAGDYTLTLTADPACANVPDDLRTRSYEVSIGLGDFGWVGFPAGANTAFRVTPKGSAFPEGLNYFWLNVAGTYVAVVLGDHTDPGVTERVGEHTYVAYGGWAAVSVESPTITISTPFQGWIDSCVNPDMGIRYDCTSSSTVTQVRCNSTKHQMTLTRR